MRPIRVTVESFVIASSLTVAAGVGLALGATNATADWMTLAGFLGALAIGGLLWLRGRPEIPIVDATRAERSTLACDAGSLRSALFSVPIAVIPVAIAADAPRQFQPIAAGLFLAWALREWQKWVALRRYERTHHLRVIASVPFIPYRTRIFTTITDSSASPT